MRRKPDAPAPETVAESVLAYDVSSDGSVVYTNGLDVHRIPAAGGSPEKILTAVDIDVLATL